MVVKTDTSKPKTNDSASIENQNDDTSDIANIPKHSMETLVFRSLKRTHDMFLSNRGIKTNDLDDEALKVKLACKIRDTYLPILHLPVAKQQNENINDNNSNSSNNNNSNTAKTPSQIAEIEISKKQYPHTAQKSKLIHHQTVTEEPVSTVSKLIDSVADEKNNNTQLALYEKKNQNQTQVAVKGPRQAPITPKAQFHPHWKLYKVISGHLGWVRCVAFEPNNQWFASGSNDRTIKIWDSASSNLKLTLTGHISHVRGLAVSDRHPYLFSCGEDKQIKCWDLEHNKAIRHYHGHLLAAYGIAIHPTLDLLITCSRDSTCRVWDMRTRASVHVLTGHQDAILNVRCQGVDPQVVTGSADNTVKLWDLAAGKCITTLTNHKKTVRALELHPTEYSFVSGSADNIKKWKFPDGGFLFNFDKRAAIVNTLSINQDNVMVAGTDNGHLNFYDYKTGYNFQSLRAPPQPGSLESEAGIFAMAFDKSGSRLVTCEADKSIKIFKEDDNSTEETHPVIYVPKIRKGGY